MPVKPCLPLRTRRFAFLFAALLPLSGCMEVAAPGFESASASTAPTLSASPSASAAFSASPPPTSSASAVVPIGSDWIPRRFCAFYDSPLSSGKLEKASAAHFDAAGIKYRVVRQEGGWVQVDSGSGPAWVPYWYGTAATDAITEEAELARIRLKPDAVLFLFPSGSSGWKLADAGPSLREAAAKDGLYSVLSWKGWRGVIVPPELPYTGERLNRPLLLWVPESGIAGRTPLPHGLLADWQGSGSAASPETSATAAGAKSAYPASLMPAGRERVVTEAILHQGMTEDQVKRWLGAPAFAEHSSNLQPDTQEPQQLGMTWRYEGPEAQFAVAFGPDKRLARWNWILPLTEEGMTGISPVQQPYEFTYDYRLLPLAPTRKGNSAWVNQGELDYAYLAGVTDEVLLIRGDDGGFSGFHENGNLVRARPVYRQEALADRCGL